MKGAPCCRDCTEHQPGTASTSAARRQDTRGRFLVEPGAQPMQGGVREFDRSWTVQAFTGAPVSTVTAGQWNRGILIRSAQPTVNLRSPGPMYDPTDPSTWRPANA